MAELFGRVDGTGGGRGGSMHIFDLERRFMGGYGIVGGNLPLAAGLGLSSDYKGDDVTVCMFGDGASNTGNFGETMNLAALWKLPVVFLVENNLYGMGTSVERHSAQTDLSKKAEGNGIPGERIDGMDVLAVREGVAEHIRLAREERRRPWSRPSPTATAATPPPTPRSTARRRRSRSGAEGPDRDLRASAASRQCARRATSSRRSASEADEQVMEAVEFADASPEPPLDTLYDNLYVVGRRSGWYAVDERSPSPSAASTSRGAEGERPRSWPRRAPPTPGSRRPAAAPPPSEADDPADEERATPRERRRRSAEGGHLMAMMRMREALRDAMAEEMRARRVASS